MQTLKRGFTLIELIVVTAILGIMAGGGIVSFVSYREKSEASADALALTEQLRKIQVKAVAVELPAGCTGSRNFTVNMSGANLTTDINCNVGSVTNAADLALALTKSVFLASYQVIFDSRTVSASPTDIDICGNHYRYRVSVSALANVAEPVYISSC